MGSGTPDPGSQNHLFWGPGYRVPEPLILLIIYGRIEKRGSWDQGPGPQIWGPRTPDSLNNVRDLGSWTQGPETPDLGSQDMGFGTPDPGPQNR